MKRLLFAPALTALLFLLPHGAQAQTARVVTTCGNTAPWGALWTPGQSNWPTVDTNGNACTAASVSATVTPFQWAARGAPVVTVTPGTSVTQAGEPAAATWIIENVGSNGIYCVPGAGPATASDMYLSPGGGGKGIGTGGATSLSCMSPSGTSTVNVTGGSGLPVLSGGGGGGGGGGNVNVTQWNSVGVGSPTAWGTAPSGNQIGVNAEMFVGAAIAAAANPMPVVPGTGATFVLGTGVNTIGSIANSSFGISGTLPAFASNPTVLQGSPPWTINLTQQAGTTLATPTAYGTAPTGNVPGANVFVTNTNANGGALAANSSPVVAATMAHTTTGALAASLVAKGSAGNLGAFNCTAITGGAAGYCIAINAISAPTSGSAITPISVCMFDTTTRGCSISRLPDTILMGTGIVILLSTNASPYTFTSGADTGFIEADYF
jgi:hypothetical protein